MIPPRGTPWTLVEEDVELPEKDPDPVSPVEPVPPDAEPAVFVAVAASGRQYPLEARRCFGDSPTALPPVVPASTRMGSVVVAQAHEISVSVAPTLTDR